MEKQEGDVLGSLAVLSGMSVFPHTHFLSSFLLCLCLGYRLGTDSTLCYSSAQPGPAVAVGHCSRWTLCVLWCPRSFSSLSPPAWPQPLSLVGEELEGAVLAPLAQAPDGMLNAVFS